MLRKIADGLTILIILAIMAIGFLYFGESKLGHDLRVQNLTSQTREVKVEACGVEKHLVVPPGKTAGVSFRGCEDYKVFTPQSWIRNRVKLDTSQPGVAKILPSAL